MNFMVIRCSICGSENVDLRYVNTRGLNPKVFCSQRCKTKGNSSTNLRWGIVYLISAFIFTIVALILGISIDIWIFYYIFSCAMIVLLGGIVAILFGRKGSRYIKEDEGLTPQELRAISTKVKYKPVIIKTSTSCRQSQAITLPTSSQAMTLTTYSPESEVVTTSVPKTSSPNKKKTNQITCFHCGANNHLKDVDSLFCNTCGNKNLRCKICNEFIEKNDKVSQLEPCGHIFHRDHIAEWIIDQDYCPECFQKIGELDLDPHNNM
ncbi:MAG: hypothetical protein KGD64_12590 [Candidatus Heimdallarchaeota archaeon]|nr:hypothetical protein [Candidatus Heimdallarchaeota archaeon]